MTARNLVRLALVRLLLDLVEWLMDGEETEGQLT